MNQSTRSGISTRQRRTAGSKRPARLRQRLCDLLLVRVPERTRAPPRSGDECDSSIHTQSCFCVTHRTSAPPNWTSNDEWDDFEWSYQRIVEQQAIANPDDKKVFEKLVRRREWIDAYLKWGRDTLGYGAYLFRKSKESA